MKEKGTTKRRRKNKSKDTDSAQGDNHQTNRRRKAKSSGSENSLGWKRAAKYNCMNRTRQDPKCIYLLYVKYLRRNSPV